MVKRYKLAMTMWSRQRPPVVIGEVSITGFYGPEQANVETKGFEDPGELADFFEALAADIRDSLTRVN